MAVTNNMLKDAPTHPLTQLVAHLSKNGAIILSRDGVIEWANPAFSKLTGYTNEELIGQRPGKLLLGEKSDPATRKYMEEQIKAKQAFTSEILNYRKSGDPFWVSLQYHPISQDGEVTHFVAVVVDLTDQRKNQEALRESESRFRYLANSAPALIWMINSDRKLEYANQAWQAFTGGVVTGQPGFEEYLHPDDRELWGKTLDEAFTKHQDFELELRMVMHDGSYRTVINQGAPRYSDDEKFTGFIGSCLDISEIKEAQTRLEEANERLRDSENKLNAFFNSTTDTNFLLGGPPNYPVLAFNKTAADAVQALFNTELTTGDNFLDYTVEELRPKFREDMEKAMSGEKVDEERKVEYEQDMVVYWKATYLPAYDEEGEVIGVAFNITNIDAQRKYELALEEKNQKLEEIAHLQSHEIRRPVASLLGLLNLLNPKNFDGENRKIVEMMHNTVHEMDNIIHKVVELTYENEQIETFNPGSNGTETTAGE